MKNKRLTTHSWSKVVTKSRIIVPKESLTSSTGFRALNLLKNKLNFTAYNNIQKASIFLLLMNHLLYSLKFTVIAFIQKILLGFCFFFWHLAISLKKYDQERSSGKLNSGIYVWVCVYPQLL
jgi:hypothetical protein